MTISAPNDQAFDRICAATRDAMARLGVPGVALGIWNQGEEHVAGFGVTSVENPLPVDANTLFQIGSISKTVTATAIARLVETGRLDLDVPIRTYLPELRLADESVAARVTLRHTLTHTGGWLGDYFGDTGQGDNALARMVDHLASLPQLTPLGQVWSYNNAGFYLAGRVLEVATSQTAEAAITDLVLNPLEMASSFFFATDVISRRYAVGHRTGGSGASVLRPWGLARAANPVGGISATVPDLLRYARFHIGDGTAPDGARLLHADSLAAMREPNAPAGGQYDSVGLSWLLRDVDGTRVVGHTGGTYGQTASLSLVPDRGFAIAILTNADAGPQLYREISALALRDYLDLAEASLVPLARSADELAEFVGLYRAALDDAELSIQDGALVLQAQPHGGFPFPTSPAPPAPPLVRLAFYADDRVVALDPPVPGVRAEFVRDPDGRVAWFRWGSRIHARQT
jgi:CubicO group peptidase (beta-lactamase class C family)